MIPNKTQTSTPDNMLDILSLINSIEPKYPMANNTNKPIQVITSITVPSKILDIQFLNKFRQICPLVFTRKHLLMKILKCNIIITYFT